MKKLLIRFQHGKNITRAYRAKCACGWVGHWCDNEFDADYEWAEHVDRERG